MTGEHWESKTGKPLNKKKDMYVRFRYHVPKEKTVATILSKKNLEKDSILTKQLLVWRELAKDVKEGDCILHKKAIPIKSVYYQIEFYNWDKKGTEDSFEICSVCLLKDAEVMKHKFEALKTLGKNPTFTPTITCGSKEVCGSFNPSSLKGHNCSHIAVRFEHKSKKVENGQVEVTMGPLLYCKRAHPNELDLQGEAELDWNVGMSGTAIMLHQMESRMKEIRKRIEENPKLLEDAKQGAIDSLGLSVEFWEKYLGIDLSQIFSQMQKLSIPKIKKANS